MKEVYSLSLENLPNNYLVSDNPDGPFLVSQNSHSISYAFLTYYTAWLKSKWPHIFIAESMISDLDDKSGATLIEVLSNYIQECHALGIGLLPPKINISDILYVPWEEDDKLFITFGLTAVDRVGSVAATGIIEERDQNGPYKSIQDVVLRGVGKKDIISNLIKVGAFDNIPILNDSDLILGRRAMLFAFGILHAWNAKNQARLKNKKEESRQPLPLEIDIDELKSIEDYTSMEYMNLEKDLLGMYLTKDILIPYVIPEGCLPISRMKADGLISGKFIGVVSARRVMTSKKGNPYLVFELYDGQDSLPVFHFYDENNKKECEIVDQIVNGMGIIVNGKLSNYGSFTAQSIKFLEIKK